MFAQVQDRKGDGKGEERSENDAQGAAGGDRVIWKVAAGTVEKGAVGEEEGVVGVEDEPAGGGVGEGAVGVEREVPVIERREVVV